MSHQRKFSNLSLADLDHVAGGVRVATPRPTTNARIARSYDGGNAGFGNDWSQGELPVVYDAAGPGHLSGGGFVQQQHYQGTPMRSDADALPGNRVDWGGQSYATQGMNPQSSLRATPSAEPDPVATSPDVDRYFGPNYNHDGSDSMTESPGRDAGNTYRDTEFV